MFKFLYLFFVFIFLSPAHSGLHSKVGVTGDFEQMLKNPSSPLPSGASLATRVTQPFAKDLLKNRSFFSNPEENLVEWNENYQTSNGNTKVSALDILKATGESRRGLLINDYLNKYKNIIEAQKDGVIGIAAGGLGFQERSCTPSEMLSIARELFDIGQSIGNNNPKLSLIIERFKETYENIQNAAIKKHLQISALLTLKGAGIATRGEMWWYADLEKATVDEKIDRYHHTMLISEIPLRSEKEAKIEEQISGGVVIKHLKGLDEKTKKEICEQKVQKGEDGLSRHNDLLLFLHRNSFEIDAEILQAILMGKNPIESIDSFIDSFVSAAQKIHPAPTILGNFKSLAIRRGGVAIRNRTTDTDDESYKSCKTILEGEWEDKIFEGIPGLNEFVQEEGNKTRRKGLMDYLPMYASLDTSQQIEFLDFYLKKFNPKKEGDISDNLASLKSLLPAYLGLNRDQLNDFVRFFQDYMTRFAPTESKSVVIKNLLAVYSTFSTKSERDEYLSYCCKQTIIFYGTSSPAIKALLPVYLMLKDDERKAFEDELFVDTYMVIRAFTSVLPLLEDPKNAEGLICKVKTNKSCEEIIGRE